MDFSEFRFRFVGRKTKMSDQYIGQKMVEEEDLYHFLDAYAEVTGQALEVVGCGERPDFICRRPRESLLVSS